MTALRPDWSGIAPEISFTVHSAVPIGEGWTVTAWRVNDELVFKFPKKARVWEELDRELSVLPYVRPLLPLSVPEHLHAVRESAGAPHGYVVSRYLPGSAADPRTLTRGERTALAETLARFLRVLHSIDPGPLSSTLPREDEYALAKQVQRDAEAVVSPQLSTSERDQLREVLAEHVDDERNFNRRSVIMHADLSVDHVLRVGDSVRGIIDWGDVSIGDPDYDFNYLYEEIGEDFIREMATYYGHPEPDRLVRKARYFSIADQIGTIVYGGDDALPGDVEASWETLRSLLSEVT